MSPEITKIIDQYLSNELSTTDKIAFEKKLAESKSLQEEVIRQQNIHAAAKRASKRTEIQQIGKSYHFFKKILTTGIVVAVIVVASSLGYLAYKMTSNSETEFSQSEEVKALIEKLKKESPINELASEFFFWEGKDSVILSNEGVLLSVPENAFLLKGKPYTKKAIIQWQEAMDPATIVKSGLSTMAGDRLLETQGMFGVQAYTKDGQKLDVNPKVGLYVQVPVDQYKSGMQLFTGSTNKEGIIDWKNPVPLQKIPVPVDMKELDFYPKGYENALNEMKKSKKKVYRDSLYLSFDEAGEYLPEAADEVMSDSTIKTGKVHPSLRKPYASFKQWEKEDEVLYNLKWNLEIKYENDGYATILGKMPLPENWNVYTGFVSTKTNNLYTNVIGVQSESFFIENENYQLIGGLQHSGRFIAADNERSISQIQEDEAIFIQRIKIVKNKPFMIDVHYDLSFTYPSHPKNIYIRRAMIQIVPLNLSKEENVGSDTTSVSNISPSKVMAFWKPQFNKTLLATREFERRMQTIHTTCDNKVLNLYTSNLSKSMQEIDEMAVSMGHPAFAEFAKEQIGALNPNSPHIKGLQSFYEREIKKLKRIVEANAKYDQKKKEWWDKDVQKERSREKDRSQNRKQKNFDEEFSYNLENVYKQLGIKEAKKTLGQFTKTIGFTIFRGGTYNVDKYVYDATVKRQSTIIVDPITGKKAKLTYHPFSFEVKESNKYGRLYAYLFPSQLNSYQRIDGTKGKFSNPLNGDIVYDLAIVGISDQGYFYHELRGVQKGDMGSLSLTTITEKEFNQKITSLNESRGIIKPMGISDELYWLVKEQKNYKEEKRRKENAEFRQKIKKVIFPCYQGEVKYEFTINM